MPTKVSKCGSVTVATLRQVPNPNILNKCNNLLEPRGSRHRRMHLKSPPFVPVASSLPASELPLPVHLRPDKTLQEGKNNRWGKGAFTLSVDHPGHSTYPSEAPRTPIAGTTGPGDTGATLARRGSAQRHDESSSCMRRPSTMHHLVRMLALKTISTQVNFRAKHQ